MPEPDAATSPTLRPAGSRVTPLWRNLNFTLTWTSAAASGFGDRMVTMAALALFGALASGIDATPINAGILFWFLLPYTLFCLFGGWIGDRLPRKWVLLACDELRGLLLLVGVLLLTLQVSGQTAVIDPDQRWQVYAVLFGIGACAAVFNPLRSAIIPQLVPGPQLQAANGIIILITVIASIIGQRVAPLIIDVDSAASVRIGLLIAVAVYVASGLFFAFLKPIDRVAAPTAARRRRSVSEALDYVRRHRRLLWLIGLNVLVWAAAYVVFNGALALTKINYGFLALPDGANRAFSAFGTLAACLGAGMLLGAIFMGWAAIRRESMILMMLGLVGAGVCTLLMAVIPVFWLGAGFAFGVGFCGSVTITGIVTMMQTLTPNYIRGRVFGLNSMISNTVNVLVNLVIWRAGHGLLGLRIPEMDRQLIIAMMVLGPLLMLVGGVALARYLTRGPIPDNRVANLAWRLTRLLTLIWHRVEWVNKHRVPTAGPVILTPNHTTALDPFLIQGGVPRIIHWLMLTSYRFKPLEPLWRAITPIFLDKDESGSDTAKIRSIVTRLKDGQAIGFFPEGSLQRDLRELQPFQPGIALVARRSGAAILPVWVEGTPRRKCIVWHFLQPSRCRVTFGEPYVPDRRASADELLAELRERMLALASGADEDHGGDAQRSST